MLPVAGVPVTEHQIARAREAGVTRIVLGTSYRAEVFSDYFGNGEQFGVDLKYVVEQVPLGTGGAIRNVASALESGPDDPVIVFNGDVLTGLDLAGLVQARVPTPCRAIPDQVDDPRAFGLVPTDAAEMSAFLGSTDPGGVTDRLTLAVTCSVAP
jgi:mannose-1-phosphate guanylyltransferase